MKLKCLIIDDEPIACQVVENYCGLLSDLEVVGSCGNALEARKLLESCNIDLIFLDINMPVLDGLAFMKTLLHPPQVIFTTAYKEYAHEAFDLAACDYLLKPFSFERFIMAVDRAKEKLPGKSPVISEPVSESCTYVKSEGKIYKLNYDEICFAEASGNNVKIVTDQGLLKPAITFAALEDLLPGSKFIRLHRSFIINKSKISHIEGNRVFIGSAEIPIGANYRELFFKEIGIK